MIKFKNNLKKVICSVSTLCLLAAVSNVGAWPWSKKKKPVEKAQVVEAKGEQSIEVIEAHKMYDKAAKETQAIYGEYQSAAAEYKRAHNDTVVVYEDLQKADALWTEAVSERDSAKDRWSIDCASNGKAYEDWRLAGEKERETRMNKESIYIEWVQKREIEKKAYVAREEAYRKYAAALVNQKNAHVTWSRVCSDANNRVK